MAYFYGRALAVVFCIILFNLFTVYTEETSKKGSSDVKDSARMKKLVFPSDLSSPDVDLADFMPMDATAGTTPPICAPNGSCAFQYFRRVHGEFSYYDPTVYCDCPEPQRCVEAGVNNKGCFFYFRCRNTTGDVSTTTEVGVRSVSNISQLSLSATSMVPQNSATEPEQPVTIKFEGDFPPSLNCEF